MNVFEFRERLIGDLAEGEYRAKGVILDICDDMQRAIDSGEPYRTRLDPPPGDPRVAHPAGARP